jgi:hypothetical protein
MYALQKKTSLQKVSESPEQILKLRAVQETISIYWLILANLSHARPSMGPNLDEHL